MNILLCILFFIYSSFQITNDPYILVIGISQDAGYPQAGCKKTCCEEAWKNNKKREMVASLALVFPNQKTYYLIDATPDIKDQMQFVEEKTGCQLNGIFLTHAHMGHYTGLMHLGREAMGTKNIDVYSMPRMKRFLENNGPWSQLVSLQNIKIIPLSNSSEVELPEGVYITPYIVPHRDEFSETVGFLIRGKNNSGWYIPDIDKWEKWETNIEDQLENDFLIVDGTFYRNGEIEGRNMSEIPHPFIQETMNRLNQVEQAKKHKIIFTHFNHTNPAMWNPEVREHVEKSGFRIAYVGMEIRI